MGLHLLCLVQKEASANASTESKVQKALKLSSTLPPRSSESGQPSAAAAAAVAGHSEGDLLRALARRPDPNSSKLLKDKYDLPKGGKGK